MEGPSIVIAVEEFTPFIGQKIKRISGTASLPLPRLKKAGLTGLQSWGKHLLLTFGQLTVRVHFLMFGSYRINNPRANRIPKLELDYGSDKIYFYSCAMKVLEDEALGAYDWSIDLMSPKWKPARAKKALGENPETMVCDILMDQAIFSGLGNIMKNEILFNQRLHPERTVSSLGKAELKSLVRESRQYALQFYKWKKANVLKRNWQIFRKKKCPICDRTVKKEKTGLGLRVSHYCSKCQPLRA